MTDTDYQYKQVYLKPKTAKLLERKREVAENFADLKKGRTRYENKQGKVTYSRVIHEALKQLEVDKNSE